MVSCLSILLKEWVAFYVWYINTLLDKKFVSFLCSGDVIGAMVEYTLTGWPSYRADTALALKGTYRGRMTRVMAIKKHSSSARTRERSCWEGRRVRWRTMRWRKDERWGNDSPSPSKGWSSCPGSGSGSRPSRCPRWTPSSWDAFGWENQSNTESATSASLNKLRRKRRRRGWGRLTPRWTCWEATSPSWPGSACWRSASWGCPCPWRLGCWELGGGLAEYRLGGGWLHLLGGLLTAFRGLSSHSGSATGGSTCCGTLSRQPYLCSTCCKGIDFGEMDDFSTTR